eukprot:12425349-Karenia_brevis.AAC.1
MPSWADDGMDGWGDGGVDDYDHYAIGAVEVEETELIGGTLMVGLLRSGHHGLAKGLTAWWGLICGVC